MLDVNIYTEVQSALESAQESDRDNRTQVKETEIFLNKKDGQWESSVIQQRGSSRPRYTFDLCNPVVAQVSNPIQKSEFAIKIIPAAGDATKKIANTYAGLVRNTENLSKAKTLIYNPATKKLVAVGLAGWEIKQKYVDSKSFDQDLIIEPIQNIRESVWLDESAQKQDGSDVRHGWKLIPLSKTEYKKLFPKGSAKSIGTNNQATAYTDKPELIIVAKFYWLKEIPTTLVQMTNSAVYEDNEDFKKIKDDLAAQGVTEAGRRETKKDVCFQRIYDGGGWLTDEEETVFEHVPLILAYANFDIIENKIVYHGEVLHLIDSQRVLNYSETKKVEETALSPKSKLLASPKQYAAHKTSWETMNTNNEPVLPWDQHADLPVPPFRLDGGVINPGLESVSQNMRTNIQGSSGMFAANMGENRFAQSGIALERQIDQGNEGKYEYFNSMVIARERTAQILVAAYPKVYDTPRQLRILNEDGTVDMIPLQTTITDEDTGQAVAIQDLNSGIYDITYDVGQAYKNQQQETIDAFLRMGEVDPSFIQRGQDIMVSQMSAPGMSQMHERIREQMVMTGQIPIEQMTEEEKAKVQAAQANQQNQPPDPGTILAMAEMKNADNDEVSNIMDFQKSQVEAQQKQQDLDRKDAELAVKVQKEQIDTLMSGQKQQMDILTQAVNQMKTLTDAFGIEAIAGEKPANLIAQQGALIDEAQDNL